jgi:hypothetical protein
MGHSERMKNSRNYPKTFHPLKDLHSQNMKTNYLIGET